MSYQKIGVYGSTGLLGQEITRALVEAGFEVVPFSRRSTDVAGLPTQAVGSLVGFDAIISVAGHDAEKEQIALIQQAKKEGVKRFIPSEFGTDHRTVTHDFFDVKKRIMKVVEQENFPDGWTAITSGFLDYLIPQIVQVQPESTCITIPGKGDKVYPFTVGHDIGRVLAQTFREPIAYKNQWLCIANGWFSLKQLAQIINERNSLGYDIRNVELPERAIVLRLAEDKGLTIFERENQTVDLPVELTDIKQKLKY